MHLFVVAGACFLSLSLLRVDEAIRIGQNSSEYILETHAEIDASINQP